MKYVKFLAALAVSLCLAGATRAFWLTPFTVSDDGLAPAMRRGSRLIVNRLSQAAPQRGDFIVFTDSTACRLAQVLKLPGDTVTLRGTRYLLPLSCCPRCQSALCRLYLVKTSAGPQLVYQHQVVGKAFRVF